MPALHPSTRTDGGGRAGPVEERRKVLAARLLGRPLALPPTVPLRGTAETTAPSRLSSVWGWRTLGRQMLAKAEVTPPIKPVLPPCIPPWERGGDVTFRLDVGPQSHWSLVINLGARNVLICFNASIFIHLAQKDGFEKQELISAT